MFDGLNELELRKLKKHHTLILLTYINNHDFDSARYCINDIEAVDKELVKKMKEEEKRILDKSFKKLLEECDWLWIKKN